MDASPKIIAFTELVVKTLRVFQKQENLKDGPFAHKLGIARSTWVHLKNGDKTLGMEAFLNIIEAYPSIIELLPLVASEYYKKIGAMGASQAHKNNSGEVNPDGKIKAYSKWGKLGGRGNKKQKDGQDGSKAQKESGLLEKSEVAQ